MRDRAVLLSFAHPDDESFLTGGTACRCAAAGVRLVLATATRGDAGKMGDPPVTTRDNLPVVREAELRSAAALLGIGEVHVLDYKDKDLAAAPPERIRGQLVGLIRRYRPHIVITFDPNGSNLHPDHIAISRFTSDAVVAAADARWYPELGEPHQIRRLLWTPPVRPWQLLRMPDLGAQPGVDFLIDVGPWWSRKLEALRLHRSQHLAVDRVFFSQPDVQRLLSTEVFRQGWGPVLDHRPLPDLFAGIEAE